MFTLAHRRAVDRIRSAQAARDRDLRIGARDLDVPVDTVAEAAETSIEHERVQGALGELSDLQRECVALAYYGGLTQSEIADAARRAARHGEDAIARRDDPTEDRTGGDDMTGTTTNSTASGASRDARRVPPSSLEAFHGLAAAYALDALDADERAEFERALAASPELRDEVDAFAQSAAHLAEQAEPVAPPPVAQGAT